MARQINASFTGVQMNDVRPRAYATESDMQRMTGDQAHVYETLTNQPTPGAGATTVTGLHNHTVSDGTNDTGALIRHPYLTSWINCRLFPREENITTAHPLFVPFFWTPVYVPPGTDVLLIGLGCGQGENRSLRRDRLRILLYRVSGSTFNPEASDPFKFDLPRMSSPFYIDTDESGSGFEFISYAVEDSQMLAPGFSAGGVYLVRIDAWDGANFNLWSDSENSASLEANYISSVVIAPVKQKPLEAPYQWVESQQTTGSAISTPAEFQPVETDWVQDDRSINSAVLTNSSRNDSLLYEVTTGRPSSNKSIPTHNGHNHADWAPGSTPARGGTTDLDDVGKDISFNLGSWYYGCLKTPALETRGVLYVDDDCEYNEGTSAAVLPPNGQQNVWGGRIIAPTFRTGAGSSGSMCTVSHHLFRLPAGTDANIGLTGGASKISLTAFVWNQATNNTIEIEATILDENGLNPGTSVTASTNTAGRSILTLNNIPCATNATGDGDIQRVRIRFSKSRNNRHCAIYGVTLYYEGTP